MRESSFGSKYFPSLKPAKRQWPIYVPHSQNYTFGPTLSRTVPLHEPDPHRLVNSKTGDKFQASNTRLSEARARRRRIRKSAIAGEDGPSRRRRCRRGGDGGALGSEHSVRLGQERGDAGIRRDEAAAGAMGDAGVRCRTHRHACTLPPIRRLLRGRRVASLRLRPRLVLRLLRKGPRRLLVLQHWQVRRLSLSSLE